jgi:N-methylhydantoinase A
MSYLGQTHTVAVTVPGLREDAGSLGLTRDGIRAAFEARYREVYGRLLDRLPIRVLNLRLAAIGRRPRFDPALLAPGPEASLAAAERPSRRVWADGAWHEATVWDRLALPVDARITGPAVLEQSDATIFIDPGLAGTVDRCGNVIIRRREA